MMLGSLAQGQTKWNQTPASDTQAHTTSWLVSGFHSKSDCVRSTPSKSLRNKARGLNNLPNTDSNTKHEDPDVHLMLRVQQDDPVAYEQLIQNYQVRLIRILQHLVGSETSAKIWLKTCFYESGAPEKVINLPPASQLGCSTSPTT